MELSWLQGLILGLISGLTEILPVSSEAHRLVILKMLGFSGEPVLLRLMIHLATLAGLYFCCRNHIVRMSRAKRLSRIPKNRRKRPLDTRSLMDLSLFKTTLIPVIVAFFFYGKTSLLGNKLVYISVLLFVNGLALYIPQYLPGSNKDSRSLSRVEGLLMGLGGAAGTLPGISPVGAAVSVGTVCGMDPVYALNTSLLMNMAVQVGRILFDFIAIFNGGLNGMSFGVFIGCVLAAATAFFGIILGMRFLKKITESVGYSVFGFYCWGASLLTFILFLSAA